MRITLVQLDPVVGDIDGNTERIDETLRLCRSDKPDLVVFPELFLTGYPPRDLLERKSFIDRSYRAVKEIMEVSAGFPDTGILFGAPLRTGKETGRGLYNSALLVKDGELPFTQHKSLLPMYDVFDEVRYFDPAPSTGVAALGDTTLGISICEDAWNDPLLFPGRFYTFDPQADLAAKGADLFVNISASPFHAGKECVRFEIFRNHAKKHSVPFVVVNQVGGNDELIFDGRSMCLDAKGDPIVVLSSFEEAIVTIDTNTPGVPGSYRPLGEAESIHRALVLGLRDYVKKCGFSKVIVSLSGGIDSAVVCCLAVEALGPESVVAATMPGPYSSAGSVGDSKALAENLGIRLLEIPVTKIYDTYTGALGDLVDREKEASVTLENIQARIRGNLIMALSNEYGCLVLSTGNKSEMAVGYCTLYGDMSGGLAVISDVPKTTVYKLAREINREWPVIPEAIILKPPSAELRPNQTDQDLLPPYEILDGILEAYIDEMDSPADIVAKGFDKETVEWVVAQVNRNEYKRRQAATGLKVTPKAFGSGRRMPIAAKYYSD
ncbi:NAD+ synthetase [Methanolacinia petrolearia DSM 11571]|uniref:Glutamine-dependent NAD(+) synthetase n=1 Tax=Methanolacinia petrolearia (strain DSM 11571 / OCM 486 / SEBR 4847) TaxID=679926 RepID=E1REV0_METP4|nr:NAD+ synthase [Methanolacinia petrolearia]ADN36121.1 NAD+ synthetase [Methanolacinia petrolearia DSM 11571]